MWRAAFVLVLCGATTAHAVLPAKDDFQRVSLGPNWTQTDIGSGVGCKTFNTDVLSAGGVSSGTFGVCFWNVDVSTTASYACGQIVHGTGSPGFELDAGVCLGVDDTGTIQPGNGVCCTASPPQNSDEWNIYQFIQDGGLTFNDFAPQAWAAGDYIGIQRTDATTFQCFRSTNGFTWTPLHAAYTLPGVPNPGSLGAYAWNAVDDPFELTVWEGGDGTLPTDHLCGTSTPVTTTTTTTTTLGTTTTASTTTSTTHTTTTTTTTTLPHPCFPTVPCPCPPT
jgi:hypothetical protein